MQEDFYKRSTASDFLVFVSLHVGDQMFEELGLYVKIPCTSLESIHGTGIFQQKNILLLLVSSIFFHFSTHDTFCSVPFVFKKYCTYQPCLFNLYLHCVLEAEVPCLKGIFLRWHVCGPN